MTIVFIGPSGVGKGTHASKLAAKFGLQHISTGDLFRDSLEKETALGLLARDYMNQGDLVPDEVVDALIEEWLRKITKEEDLLIDGFPRTLYQAEFLDEIIEEMGRNLEAVIYLDASDDEIIRRLSGRLICRVCQTPFHKTYAPFESCPVAAQCQGEHLYQRIDDKPDALRVRLDIFHREVVPVLTHFLEQKKLIVVNSEEEIDMVYKTLVKIIEAVKQNEAPLATPKDLARIKALQGKPVYRLSAEQATHTGLDLVLLAPPGAGKGTQAELLNKRLGLKHIASGDIFRENIRNKTELGIMAQTFMNRGKLVPDDVTERMLQERLSRPDISNGFVLDGFPRTRPQAEALAGMMHQMKRQLDTVIYINVSDDEIVSRLAGRLICRNCQTPYHIKYNPPAHKGVCDKCGGELYRRQDDNPETIYARLAVYNKQTAPLVDYYRQAGLLIEVDGENDVTTVSERIQAAINTLMTVAVN